ncbi:MAG: hypothetical protein HLUCCO02_01745 [Idiomarinaceae bacterium HL-53]|nr:MAG: hypothetical protein HLUCCO02_01745 [Idiomarinaceae bacterium HL-53]
MHVPSSIYCVIKNLQLRVVNYFLKGLCLGVIALSLNASAPSFTNKSTVQPVAVLAAAEQGNVTAQLYLAAHYATENSRSQQIYWLERAASAGFAAAALKLSDLIPAQRLLWLERAADLGDLSAQIKWSARNLNERPKLTLESRSDLELDAQTQELLAEVLLAWQADFPTYHWRNEAPNSEVWQQRRLGANRLLELAQTCTRDVHFYLTAPEHLVSVYEWIAKLESVFARVNGQVCYRTSLVMDLQCGVRDERAFCEVVPSTYPEETGVIVTRNGYANTLNGQVHIQHSASWRILLHELGHAWGFADEYAMRSDIRGQFCGGEFNFQAKNLIISQGSLISDNRFQEFKDLVPWREFLSNEMGQPIQLQGVRYWQLGLGNERGSLGLYPAATCEGLTEQAWKPVGETTFMEAAETGAIPDPYLRWMLE